MNFETIYSKEIFFEDKCWKKCGGGFCCNNENDNFDFQHIKTKGSTIFYLPREYYYANKNLKTFQNQYGTPPIILK